MNFSMPLTPTPEMRELLLRADDFTVGELWIMLRAMVEQHNEEQDK